MERSRGEVKHMEPRILMKQLRKEIVSCFGKYARQDDLLISELERKVSENGDHVYSLIFDILTHLRIESDRASELWQGILRHREAMIDKLGREVVLRTAICDYLCSVCRSLENPVVVELNVFEDHCQSQYFDSLTGLYSRKFLSPTITRELSRAQRHNSALSLIFFDIDNFKVVNDTYGHLAGDQCLIKIASIIMSEVRTEDMAIRYGGEEILVILPHSEKLQALVIGERIRRRVKMHLFRFDGEDMNVTLSGGIASFPEDGKNIETLIRYADMAMYQAKANGKDNIAINSHEKRRYIRVDYKEMIQFEILGHEEIATLCSAYGKNISRTGLLFEMDHPIEIGTRLNLNLPIERCDREEGDQETIENKDDGRDLLNIRGVVVRNELRSEGEISYDIGISFLEMGSSALEEISGYVYQAIESLERLLNMEKGYCAENR